MNRLQKYYKIRRILDTTVLDILVNLSADSRVKFLQLICRKGASIVLQDITLTGQLIQNIELGERYGREPINHMRVLQQHGVQPAAAPGPARGDAELVAALLEEGAHAVQLVF